MSLVNKEVADLAKEKGFDELCIDTFTDGGHAPSRYNIDIACIYDGSSSLFYEFTNTNTMLIEIGEKYKAEPYVSRPYQRDLEDWLRAKGLVIETNISVGGHYHIRIMHDDPTVRWVQFISAVVVEFTSEDYNEAMNVALVEALKLIV